MSITDKKRMDAKRIGALLVACRAELGWGQAAMAKSLGVDPRTLHRWQIGAALPRASHRESIAACLGGASGETWRALVGALELSLDAMLNVVPTQREKIAPAPAPAPALAPTPVPVHAHAALDAAVRAYAEDLDVSPRRLRLALALFLAHLDELGLTPAVARTLVVHRADGEPGRRPFA